MIAPRSRLPSREFEPLGQIGRGAGFGEAHRERSVRPSAVASETSLCAEPQCERRRFVFVRRELISQQIERAATADGNLTHRPPKSPAVQCRLSLPC